MKDQEIFVSIKCAVYNHEQYIRQCLDGIVMQKTNFCFEAIVHDDASTDSSAAIIREYAEKYPHIIKPIYETENQYSKRDGSLTRIMNAACKGKYIAVCEGDDYWIDPLKLQKQVDFMEAHPNYSLCGSNGLIIWEDGVKRPKYFNNCFKSKDVTLEEIVNTWFFPTASLLYKREIYNNYPEWTSKIYSGDQTLVLLNYDRGKVYCLSDLTCVYRKSNINPYSISNNARKNKLFVPQQHIMLYEKYNEYTNAKYSIIIEGKLKQLRKEIKYLKLNKICIFLPYILLFKYTLTKKTFPRFKKLFNK